MKVKKLTEFINWFANSRHRYNQCSSCDCIAGQCLRWMAPKGRRNGYDIDGTPYVLCEAFDIPLADASAIYTAAYSNEANRKVAVELLRHYRNTRKVNWPRAIGVITARKVTARSTRAW